MQSEEENQTLTLHSIVQPKQPTTQIDH